MTKEHEEHLFNKYPLLYAGRGLPPTQSLLCFGMECGDGWFDLIDYWKYIYYHGEEPKKAKEDKYLVTRGKHVKVARLETALELVKNQLLERGAFDGCISKVKE